MKSELQRQQGRQIEITEKLLIKEKNIYRQEIKPRISKTVQSQNLNQTLQNNYTGITGKFFLLTLVEF